MISPDNKIFVAGASGMVGRSIVRDLRRRGYSNLLTPSSSETDLTNQSQVNKLFESESPDCVIVAAAKVGGIGANNTYRADFIYRNLMIAANVIHAAYTSGVGKLVFLGSSCAYPREAPQPMREEHLLAGSLELTNEPYAIAKIAGIKLCESYHRQHGCNFISLTPTNLYGPHDNFDAETSHVIPGLIGKFHVAKLEGRPTVELWGTGTPRREFMHVDDLAAAVAFVVEQVEADNLYGEGISHLNVGTGEDISIAEAAEIIKEISGFTGDISWDSSKPDGPRRKLLDVSRLARLGWRHRVDLRAGLAETYEWYLNVLHKNPNEGTSVITTKIGNTEVNRASGIEWP